MPRGGRRPGAGRKRGSLSKKTTEIAAELGARGLSPLEVMILAMRYYHDAGNLDRAAAIARDAAPYMHARLSSIQVGGGFTPIRVEYVVEIVEVRNDPGE
jgi:hypothetical protein